MTQICEEPAQPSLIFGQTTPNSGPVPTYAFPPPSTTKERNCFIIKRKQRHLLFMLVRSQSHHKTLNKIHRIGENVSEILLLTVGDAFFYPPPHRNCSVHVYATFHQTFISSFGCLGATLHFAALITGECEWLFRFWLVDYCMGIIFFIHN